MIDDTLKCTIEQSRIGPLIPETGEDMGIGLIERYPLLFTV